MESQPPQKSPHENRALNIFGLVLCGLLIAALSSFATYLFLQNQTSRSEKSSKKPGGVVCTMDARSCPDGSYVGRVPPSCEFAPCPLAKVGKQSPSPEIEKAVITYQPSGLFSETEKGEIQRKVINPFLDWEKEQGFIYATVSIEKYNPLKGDYKYSLEAINKNGGTHAFLFGDKDPLEFWVPDCMGGCEFSGEYSQKYPEVIKRYNEVNK